MRSLACLFACAALLTVPATTAAAKEQGPGAFVVWELYQVNAGNWPALWKRIHPAQRRHVKELVYVGCNAQLDTGWKFTGIRILAVESVRAKVPGTTVGPVAAKAVTVRMKLRSSGGQTTIQKQTVNVFRVKRLWYSTLTAKQFKAYEAGRCHGATSTG